MIWYDCYWGHDVWTLGSAEEEVIGGMAGRFTRKFVKERGAVRSKKDTTDNCSLRHQQDDASGRHG